ncbi:hypothetical protein [Oryza sativa Japonica Group]|uniref:Uncharacterized protein n=1 Tax=Oryza sativa subsp. japonica TaxID=39947 RepID=Q94J06_ORYSJ|nr:hypothetical protein [Oryza sativa Japonica Group]
MSSRRAVRPSRGTAKAAAQAAAAAAAVKRAATLRANAKTVRVVAAQDVLHVKALSDYATVHEMSPTSTGVGVDTFALAVLENASVTHGLFRYGFR